MSEAGEPTVARGSRRLSVVRAVHEPTRSESEGEQVYGLEYGNRAALVAEGEALPAALADGARGDGKCLGI